LWLKDREQFERRRSIEAHDFPKSPASLARRRGGRTPMAGAVRYQSPHPRNQRLRTRHDGLVRFHHRTHYLVGVLQSRQPQGTLRRTRNHCPRVRRDVVLAARIDVAAMVIWLRHSVFESRFRHLGGSDTPAAGSHSTRDDGCDDSDRLRRVVVHQAKRNQWRSPGRVWMALVEKL